MSMSQPLTLSNKKDSPKLSDLARYNRGIIPAETLVRMVHDIIRYSNDNNGKEYILDLLPIKGNLMVSDKGNCDIAKSLSEILLEWQKKGYSLSSIFNLDNQELADKQYSKEDVDKYIIASFEFWMNCIRQYYTEERLLTICSRLPIVNRNHMIYSLTDVVLYIRKSYRVFVYILYTLVNCSTFIDTDKKDMVLDSVDDVSISDLQGTIEEIIETMYEHSK